MLDELRIANVGDFRHAQDFRGILHFDGLSLNIRDLAFFAYENQTYEKPGPFLMVARKGCLCQSTYGSNRENWVIIFENSTFRASEMPGFVEMVDGRQRFRLPLMTWLEEDKVVLFRQEFMQVREALASPVPENQLYAKLTVLNILRFIINTTRTQPQLSPAKLLRQQIDNDERFEQSLADLSMACGYSVDHLRILFQQEYQMSPGQYRALRRLALANNYLSNTRLSIKEIAGRLGFEHTSAFSAFYRKATGKSPKEMAKTHQIQLYF